VINNNPQCPPAVIDPQRLSRINAIAWTRLVGKRSTTVAKSQREVHLVHKTVTVVCHVFFAMTLKIVDTFPRNLALSYSNNSWTVCVKTINHLHVYTHTHTICNVTSDKLWQNSVISRVRKFSTCTEVSGVWIHWLVRQIKPAQLAFGRTLIWLTYLLSLLT